jgi:hypothetical protein
MRILKKQDLNDLLFIDIETAPAEAIFNEASPLWDAWGHYCIHNNIENVTESYNEKAALFPEFGRITSITIGVVREGNIRLKSFNGNEKELLEGFNITLDKLVNNKTWLVGHMITSFDAPYIMKRCLVHRLELNILFDIAHLKPWETSYLDTAVLWKGTSYKMSSLMSILACLGISSSEWDKKHSEKNVISVINIVSTLRGEVLMELAVLEEEKPIGVLTYLFQGGKYTDEVKQKLQAAVNKIPKTRKAHAMEILNSIPSRAKGKVTDFTKKHIKELQ